MKTAKTLAKMGLTFQGQILYNKKTEFKSSEELLQKGEHAVRFAARRPGSLQK